MPKHLAEPVGGPDSRPSRQPAECDRRSSRRIRPVRARRPIARAQRRRWAAGLVAATVLVPVGLHMASAASDPSPVVAQDSFARTVRGGWGSAPVGGAWTVSAPAAASVGAGAGRFSLRPADTVSALLRSAHAADADARITLGVDRCAAGNGLYTSLVLRRQADRSSYRVQARLTADCSVRLSLIRTNGTASHALTREVPVGVVAVQGSPIVVEGSISGTSPVVLRARVWSGRAPAGWSVTASDRASSRVTAAGAVGVVSYLSSAASPVTASFADLRVTTLVDGPAVSASPSPSRPPASATPSAPNSATPTASSSAPASPTPSSPSSAPPAAGTRAASSAGAAAPGMSRYPVPAGAVVVAPGGDDGGAGTVQSPFRTVTRAVAAAPSGATVVLRAGSYHESVTVPASKRLVVQPYPGEAVWLDGSSPVRDWTGSGSSWVHEGWTTTFDSTPCYNAGSCATSDPNFQFVSSSAPMAAHPDQVFVDGAPQAQVASAAEVRPGTFFVDAAAHRLYLGTDPRGHDVVASDLTVAVTLQSRGSVLRGFGVRRYGTPLPKMGTVRLTGPDETLENVTVVDNATTGVAVTATGATVRNVTADRNGMLGVGVNYADRVTITGLRAERNNTEHFKTAPVAGGIKITRTRGVRMSASRIAGNEGTGVWLDESVYDASVTGSDVLDNQGHGISFEISAKGLFADDVVSGNARDGMKINDSEGVRIWNSTLQHNGRTIEVVQDGRLASDHGTAGHDPRQAFPDPTMTWLVGKVQLRNSVLGLPVSGANCVLCVEDYSHRRSAAQMDVTEDADLFQRTAAGAPSWLVVWSSGAGNPATFTTLSAFTAATGQGRHSADVVGAAAGTAAARSAGGVAPAPQPLPSDVAALVGRNAGELHLGAWA